MKPLNIKISRVREGGPHCGCGQPFKFRADLPDGRTLYYWCLPCDRGVK